MSGLGQTVSSHRSDPWVRLNKSGPRTIIGLRVGHEPGFHDILLLTSVQHLTYSSHKTLGPQVDASIEKPLKTEVAESRQKTCVAANICESEVAVDCQLATDLQSCLVVDNYTSQRRKALSMISQVDIEYNPSFASMRQLQPVTAAARLKCPPCPLAMIRGLNSTIDRFSRNFQQGLLMSVLFLRD